MDARKNARWILTIGLAYVFVSFGVGKIVQPLLWIGWMPLWMEDLLGFDRAQWLLGIGIAETILGLLLLIPKPKILKAVVSIHIMYLGVVLTQTGLFNDIGVRDTGLLLAALSLFFLARET